MIILGLDPGKTTGAAMIDWDGASIPPEPTSLVFAEQISFSMLPQWVDMTLNDYAVDLIVVERFFISERTIRSTRQMEPIYAIGGVLFLSSLRGLDVVMQAASDAKTAYPNEALAGWKVKGPHAKDALRHALLATHRRGVYTAPCKND